MKKEFKTIWDQIITKTVMIRLAGNNVKYYENLGYKIPRIKNKWNKYQFKNGTTIKVVVCDLQHSSNVKIEVICYICRKRKLIKYSMFYRRFILKNRLYYCTKCVKQTKEFKEKQRIIQTGKKHSEETKNKIGDANKGKKLSKETKIKLSVQKIGNKNPMWDPNLTNEERSEKRTISGLSKWKNAVKERDNNTCQICGSKENIRKHHLNNWKNFPNERLLVENGICLCQSCHYGHGTGIHSLFGRCTTKDDYEKFKKAKQIRS